MTDEIKKLRDEMAANESKYCICAGPTCSGCEEASEKQFKKGFDAGFAEAMKQAEGLIKALEYYANETNWYLHKDPVTGSEIRRSIQLDDTESFGYQKYPESENILQVFAGKHAREALVEWNKKVGECICGETNK